MTERELDPGFDPGDLEAGLTEESQESVVALDEQAAAEHGMPGEAEVEGEPLDEDELLAQDELLPEDQEGGE